MVYHRRTSSNLFPLELDFLCLVSGHLLLCHLDLFRFITILLFCHLHAGIELLFPILRIFVKCHIVGWVCRKGLSHFRWQILIGCISPEVCMLPYSLLGHLGNKDFVESTDILDYLRLSLAHLYREGVIVQTAICNTTLEATIACLM